jgi:GNAT superfamily N-acetyltransferase
MVHISEVDAVIEGANDPLPELPAAPITDLDRQVADYIVREIGDGVCLQIGIGGMPNAVCSAIAQSKLHDLGIHTEMFVDGMVDLVEAGKVSGRRKHSHPGKIVFTFAVGNKRSYDFIDGNELCLSLPVDQTNLPHKIAENPNVVSINNCMQIDLSGQVASESAGHRHVSGTGGQLQFVRGAFMSDGGKSFMCLSSRYMKGVNPASRIVCGLEPGTVVTTPRTDVMYVVTEYGIANLRGRSVRERAMSLIGISHPMFRPRLMEAARKLSLVYRDQIYRSSDYPEDLEAWKVTRSGLWIFLRPVKISDEPLVKEFFYSLSDKTLYRRFASARREMHHSRIQDFVAVDYSRDMVILALLLRGDREVVIGIGQYSRGGRAELAELAVVVRDDYQRRGVGTLLHTYLTDIAEKRGLVGFTAEVLEDNLPALKLIKKMGFERVAMDGGAEEMRIVFDGAGRR